MLYIYIYIYNFIHIYIYIYNYTNIYIYSSTFWDPEARGSGHIHAGSLSEDGFLMVQFSCGLMWNHMDSSGLLRDSRISIIIFQCPTFFGMGHMYLFYPSLFEKRTRTVYAKDPRQEDSCNTIVQQWYSP